MFKKTTQLLILTMALLFNNSYAAPKDAGKLRISSDRAGAYIYINGRKKAMTSDEGYTSILLAEGEYKVKVEKVTDEWIYSKTREVFLGADISINLKFNLDKRATEKRKQRLAKEKIAIEKFLAVGKIAKEKRLAKQAELDKKSGTVSIGNLIWKRCAEGQTWNGDTCTGKGKRYKWQARFDHFKTVSFAGYTDWRLPTIKELNTLIYCSNGYQVQSKKDDFDSCAKGGKNYQTPTINQTLFPGLPGSLFWPSSANLNSSSYAWMVSFYHGFGNVNDRNNYYYIRLVRSGE
ncbi:hypothetical protein BHECKSOX_1103 [Bathymodiolus heckerae thiotrophic gill symbiont]|uniref:Lcl domain-containing protein n=1 Tax=Bathymodiolus heckerae thiotrophic gill symbiont TaxID=1052212 RepID=UPI0010B814A2|nr:DUF1566 domain-containing protein [Bathymodiolus heckerae thiotrophic gill symbiont]SHN92583.1 hypothetical protein BHECKSOX_1103 [Bathymodiolus heckerae thiotrophic gill symbiont]